MKKFLIFLAFSFSLAAQTYTNSVQCNGTPCSNLTPVTTGVAAQYSLVPTLPAISKLYAFGDSITYGFLATSPYNGWPYWIASGIGIPTGDVVNDAYSGYLSGQLDPLIFNQSIAYTPHSLIVNMGGNTNLNNFSTDPNQEQNYLANIEAQDAYMLMGSTVSPFSGATCTGGTWVADAYGIGQRSSNNGASCSFTLTGTTLYLATGLSTGNGAASLTCGGTAQTAPLFIGYGGSTLLVAQTYLQRYTGLTVGQTCTVTVTSSTGNVDLVWYGSPPTSPNTISPYLVEVGLSNQNTASSTVISAIAQYNTQQQTAVTMLQGDNLSNVAYVSTAAVGGVSNAYLYNDQYHFTDYGYYLLSQPILTGVNTLTGQTFANAQFIPRTVSNFAKGGPNSMCLMSGCGTASGWAATRVIGIGVNTLQAATTATDDVFEGFSVAQMCTTCTDDIGIGSTVLQHITTGLRDVAIGNGAMYDATTTAADSTAIGAGALQNGVCAYANTSALGSQAGYLNCGNLNTFIGAQTGIGTNSVTTDTELTFLGELSNKNTATILTNSTAVGYDAAISASNQMVYGINTTVQQIFNGIIAVTDGGSLGSATTIVPTKPVTTVTGTAAISTINAPPACVNTGFDCTIKFIPSAIWTTVTGGNIALASTAVVGKVLELTYLPSTSLWYPSY